MIAKPLFETPCRAPFRISLVLLHIGRRRSFAVALSLLTRATTIWIQVTTNTSTLPPGCGHSRKPSTIYASATVSLENQAGRILCRLPSISSQNTVALNKTMRGCASPTADRSSGPSTPCVSAANIAPFALAHSDLKVGTRSLSLRGP